MTKTKIDYSKGLIYKIVCKDLQCKDLYVGSTTDFTRRKYEHKSNCTNENTKKYNLKLYQTIRANGGWGNWSMIEIEKYNCKDGNELRARERLYYEELNGTLNTCIPNRSQKEYEETNTEKIKEYYKKYNKTNKEIIKEYKKQYYENNKEILKEKNKEYREQNKEILKEQQKQKIDCMCGSTFRKCTKARHERSKKHINYVNSQLD